MLEVQEERPAATGTVATHFAKKERGKKEREEAKEGRTAAGIGPNVGPRSGRTKATHALTAGAHQHLTPPSSVGLGSPSMHSSNPKVRNSPSANTQSSPKSKQEAMVRSPPVMSPSSASQMDSSKLQGKQGGAGTQSQASPCDGKTLSASHTPKGSQGVGGAMGLKNGQGLTSGSKVKVKRERSTSVESFEQHDAGTPNNEVEAKDVGSRVKRMCVAERRQPYSGADWCSGGESEDDEAGFYNCNSSDGKPQDSNSHPASNAGLSRSSTPSHNALVPQNAVSEAPGGQKAPSKVVYVFTTEMANKAADAVVTGHSENIITFHMKNISKDKPHVPLNNQMGLIRSDSKPPQQQLSHPADHNHQQTPTKGPQGQPQHTPPHPLPQGIKPGGLPQDGASAAAMDTKGLPSPRISTPHDGASGNLTPGTRSEPVFPSLEQPRPGDSRLTPQQQQLAQELMSSMEPTSEGLSQEQLEHRERSLQTLRDIQRMLFPDDKDMAAMGALGNPGAGPPPQHNAPLMEGGLPKKPEQGPLQAMIAQSQSLGKPGGPGGPRPEGPPFGGLPGPRDMPFSSDELGPLPPSHMGPGMGDHGEMTPEQMAWLKLQQEFYEEKKRKQDMHHQRPGMPDMMMHGPRGMSRGPPPPYQMNPGDVWGPGGPEPFPEQMNMGPRGMHPHMQRMPGFQGMMNPDVEGPPRPGMNWPDDMGKMADGRGFLPGQGGFVGPGSRGERFPNPQAVQEAMFQQGMAGEKGMGGLPPGMMMDMNRMVVHQRPGMEPGNGNNSVMMFPRMPGEGPMSPASRMEFVKGLGRDLGPAEFGMGGPGNMTMGPGPQMMQSKMREHPMNMSPEEMMKMRQGGGGPQPDGMGPQQRMMQGHPFPDQPQIGDFPGGPHRHFPNMSQGPSNMRGPRGEQPFGHDNRTNMGGNGRLSHLPPHLHNQPPNLGPPQNQRGMGGRKPAELSVQAGGHSPSMNSLKSPTLRQVQSPMLGSPSGALKSPQTPSQLAGMLTGPGAGAMAAAVASIKSPPIMGSAGASPVHMKSPSLPNPSPGWALSPKPPMQSPGIPQNSKPQLSMTSPNMMGNVEQGGNGPPSAPPSSSSSGQPASANHPGGNHPSGSPYALPSDHPLSQNPLSIMMSRMSKFAMPSSTPLYHDAIKTVASSDDDSPPARSPNLPSLNNMGGMGLNHHPGHPRMMVPSSSGPMPSLSPMGMNTMGSQPLSHGIPSQMPSPGMPSHGGPMGPGMMPQDPRIMMMGPGPQDPGMGNPQMIPQGRMGYHHRGQGFPAGQSPPQQGPFPHNGPSPHGPYSHGMGFQGEGGGRMAGGLHHGPTDGGMCKPGPQQEPFGHMQGAFNHSDLDEVMRPGASGIPEFDLSRIIPSEKPSQTLSYFPRGGEGPGGKPPHPASFAQMQGMLGEGNPRMGMGGQLGPGHMVGHQDMAMGNPNHNPMRSSGFIGQGMMGPQHRMMSPGQPGMPGQQGMMGGPGMMQGKERGGLYNHPGPVGSPNMMMSLHGMGGPQQTMMMGQMRPRGMAADMGMGFNPGPGMF